MEIGSESEEECPQELVLGVRWSLQLTSKSDGLKWQWPRSVPIVGEVKIILYCWLWGHDWESPFLLSHILLSTMNHLEIFDLS